MTAKIYDIGDHMAFMCPCGSVHFTLIKTGNIECANCLQIMDRVWVKHTSTSKDNVDYQLKRFGGEQ